MRGRDGVNDEHTTAMHSQECSCSSPEDEAAATTLVLRDEEGNDDDNHNNKGQRNNVHCGQTKVPCPVRREALRLNHEAVKILVSGTGEEKALRMLKSALCSLKAKRASSSTGTTSSSVSRATTMSVVDNKNSKELHADDVFTFHLPTNLDNKTRQLCLSSMIDSESLSATIIYNIAVLLTMRGIRANTSILLKKAFDLFKLSLGLLQHPSNVHSSMTTSLAVVCWNNLGQIAYILCDFDDVQKVRHILPTLLTESFSIPSVEQPESAGACPHLFLFDEVEIQGFKSNIMFMYPPNNAPAA